MHLHQKLHRPLFPATITIATATAHAAALICKNQLNDLPTLFGVEADPKKPLSVTACFRQCLATNGDLNLKIF